MNAECSCERTMGRLFDGCQDEEYGRCRECEASSCAIQESVQAEFYVLGVVDMGELPR